MSEWASWDCSKGNMNSFYFFQEDTQILEKRRGIFKGGIVNPELFGKWLYTMCLYACFYVCVCVCVCMCVCVCVCVCVFTNTPFVALVAWYGVVFVVVTLQSRCLLGFFTDVRFDCGGEEPDSSMALQSCFVSLYPRHVCRLHEVMKSLCYL